MPRVPMLSARTQFGFHVPRQHRFEVLQACGVRQCAEDAREIRMRHATRDPYFGFSTIPCSFGFFLVGFIQSNAHERRVLYLCLTAAFAVLILLPPLSQARYYPILILTMWAMAIKGGRWFGISPLTLQVLFFCWTAVSIVSADLKHIADA